MAFYVIASPGALKWKHNKDYKSSWSEKLILSWYHLHLDLKKSVYLFFQTLLPVLNWESMEIKSPSLVTYIVKSLNA